MIKIFIAEIPPVYDEAVFQAYCQKVDKERLEKVLRIRPEQSRMRSLLAGYCLQYGMKEVLGIRGDEPLSLAYRSGEQGKPYLADYPDLFFNLSHSGRFAACGIDNREIGIDIQEEQAVAERLAERFFTSEEYTELQAIEDLSVRQSLFFRLWAVKESYIKLSGMGMKQGLNTFRIDWEQERIDDFTNQGQACFKEAEIEPGIHLSVCGYGLMKSGDVVVTRIKV